MSVHCPLSAGDWTYGVARFETSFVIYSLSVLWKGFVVDLKSDAYHIHTPIARNGNDSVQRSKVNPHYTHDCELLIRLPPTICETAVKSEQNRKSQSGRES